MSRQLEQTDQLYKSGMVQKKIAERLGIAEGDGNLSPAKTQRNLPHQKSAPASAQIQAEKNKFPTKKNTVPNGTGCIAVKEKRPMT